MDKVLIYNTFACMALMNKMKGLHLSFDKFMEYTLHLTDSGERTIDNCISYAYHGLKERDVGPNWY